ncbi:MAG: CHC2 zinc finger domain-containing protein, partial [Brevinematia bacterium]
MTIRDIIFEIKNRLIIEDIIGRYVNLKKVGKSYVGLCPFHHEKTPSFYVTPDKGLYHCFGCGRSGDVFKFIMEIEKISFM